MHHISDIKTNICVILTKNTKNTILFSLYKKQKKFKVTKRLFFYLWLMKIALVHDLLVKLWGAEKVLKKLSLMYPNADIFPLIYDEEKVWKDFPKEKIKYIPSSTQNIYNFTKNQRFCLPFMAKAVESIDLWEYDVVIVSNSAFAHGVITKPETKTIVYYHTPARYMWDRTFEYKREIGWNVGIKKLIINWMLHSLRMWDFTASQRHDITLANSHNVVKRLKKYYHLDADVIYPNVEVHRFNKKVSGDFSLPVQEYYIIISALTEFKKIDLSIRAFNALPDKNLVVVGTGNYAESLKKMSQKNIHFAWAKYDDELVYLLQNAKWLIFSGEEDFGIVPIEAFWAGKPVFAYKAWGLAETMIEWVTWEFFLEKDGSDFLQNFKRFDENISKNLYQADVIKNHAANFSEEIFEQKIREIVWF